MKKQGKDFFNVQLLRNEVCKPQKFQAILESAIKGDLTGALSSILENILMKNNIRSCYTCKIGEIGDYEIREAYDRLQNNGVLKPEHQKVAEKGLVHALYFSQYFKVDWIKIILSRMDDMQLWLEDGPV